MRALLFGLAMGAAVTLTGLATQPVAQTAGPAGDTLRQVSEFEAIADPAERSKALFTEVGKVLTHPRCMNCHPKDDVPTQGDAMTPHQPHVVRGDGDMGAPGLFCNTCHHDANYDVAGVPGDPAWALAPIEMAWQGKTLGEICAQLKDPARNGGKTPEEMAHHMEADHLVGWGWNPGKGRTPVPGTQAEFGALFRAWQASGSVCPA
jgi:hypothetical protein